MKKKNAKRLLALLVCLPLLCGVIFFTAKEKKADAASSYNIETYSPMQTFDGWGTSLIWWANNVGKYDWEAAGGETTVREEIMELLYGKDGLEYNIARFNVGGGDNPNHDHVTKPQHMQGYSTLDESFLPTYDGDNTTPELNDWATKKSGWTMDDVTYDWESDDGLTTDAAQRWCMEWIYGNAEKIGTKNELITEYFSNSPPWYMTETACASGNGNKSNLTSGREDEFAKYFVEVLLHLVKEEGYKVEYVDPFNESTSDWWSVRSQKQEGCKMTDAQRAQVLYYVVDELEEHPELAGIKIAFDDSTGADKAWAAYTALKSNTYFTKTTDKGNSVQSYMGKLNYHLYEGSASSEKKIADEAVAKGWRNWMSEMGYNSAQSATSSTLQTGYLHTDKIRQTIYDGANAYVLWQVIEELSSQLNAPEYGYGPIKVSYNSAEDVPDLVNYGYTLGSYFVGKQYYMLGQYSKYIRPGYKILPTSDPNGVAAISPDGDKVVLVHTNNSTTEDTVNFTLLGHYITNAQVIVTDEDQNWAKSSLAASGNKFSYTVNPYSVTTFVFDVDQYAEKPAPGVTTYYEVYNRSTAPSGAQKNQGIKLTDATLPSVADIFAATDTTYAMNKIYLTSGWNTSDNNGTHGRYYIQGADGAGGFFKFTGANKVDLIFRCKNDSGDVKFAIYEKGASAYTLVERTDYVSMSQSGDDAKSVWSKTKLDETKTYLVVFEPKSGQWSDYYGYSTTLGGIEVEYEAPQISTATVKGGNLYLSVTEETPASQYKVYWREVGTDDVHEETVDYADISGTAIATGLTGNAYDIWVSDTAGEKYSQTVTVRNANVDNKLLYYVNAGTDNVGSYSIYENAAVNNTYQDQAYGADPITGKEWGLVSAGNKGYTSGTAGSIYQAMGDVVSTDGNADSEIVYKFEVEGGNTYDIMLGAICPWAARPEDVSVNGTKVGKFTIDGSENFIAITGIAPDAGFITIKVSIPTGETEGSVLGTIMISKSGDPANAFATAAEVQDVTPSGSAANVKHYRFGGLTAGYVGTISVTKAYVYGVDGVATPKTSGVTFDPIVITNSSPNAEAGRITGIVDGLYFNTPLTLTSDIATVYYNIDCGSDGGNASAPGSLQGGVADQETSGGSWGYTGSHTSGWRDENALNSVHYDIKDSFYYTLTNLPAGDDVDVEVCGKDPNNWGGRSYDVYFGTNKSSYNGSGNKKIGTVTVPKGAYGTMRTSLTIPAATCYMFFHATTGGDPFLSYITIATPADDVPAAPTLNKTEAKKTDTVKVSGLEKDDLLVINSADGSRIGEVVITGESMNVDLTQFDIPESAEAVMFSVRHDGSLEESTATMLALPKVHVSGIQEVWSHSMVLHFSPSMGVTLQKLVVVAPSGERTDVTKREYFNYVVHENGDHTVYLTTKANETYEQTVSIDKIDVILFNAVYDAGLTYQDVAVTVELLCSTGSLKEFYVDGEEKELVNNKYSFTVTDNTKYVFKAISQLDLEYEYELDITNINKEAIAFAVTPTFTDADAFVAELVSNNLVGGSFSVTKGGKYYGGTNGLHLVEAGEYTVTYTAGNRRQQSFTVKLGYGAGELATLSGNTLSGIAAGAKVYLMGTGDEVTVTDGSCTLTTGNRYLIFSESNGNYEVAIITVEAGAYDTDPTPAPAPAAPAAKKGCGSAAGAALPMAAIVLLLAGAGLALAKKGGKRA
ncbi:MAG: hypothetical protein K2M95_06685 [Clostridiales bacterium]|nr:hypothetical protein [Clostridiales bacterium]